MTTIVFERLRRGDVTDTRELRMVILAKEDALREPKRQKGKAFINRSLAAKATLTDAYASFETELEPGEYKFEAGIDFSRSVVVFGEQFIEIPASDDLVRIRCELVDEVNDLNNRLMARGERRYTTGVGFAIKFVTLDSARDADPEAAVRGRNSASTELSAGASFLEAPTPIPLPVEQISAHVPEILETGTPYDDSLEHHEERAIDGSATRASLTLTSELTSNSTVVKASDLGIFISYRRTDEPGFAGRLYDRLEARFGKDRVFMDVDSIDLGLDFAEELDRALDRSTALIVIIGSRWLSVMNPFGERRLDDPDDFVRLEIERALARKIRVIPILVDGASMPRRQDLPESLVPLARRNGQMMTHARFGSDSRELISTLERILAVP